MPAVFAVGTLPPPPITLTGGGELSRTTMASFNRVLLIGNLTRDPELRYLPSQMAVAQFGMACNRKFKDASGQQKEDVLFVDCTAWGKSAEIINQYCRKGKQLFIEGRLKLDQWEDKSGGGKRSKLTIVVENFQLLGSKDDAGASPGSDSAAPWTPDDSTPAPATNRAGPGAAMVAAGRQAMANRPAPPQESPIGDESHFTDDGIPF